MAGHLPGHGFESLLSIFPSFSSLFLTFLSYWLWLGLRSGCQVWSISKIWACAFHFVLFTPLPPEMGAGGDENLVIKFMLRYISIHLAQYTCMDSCVHPWLAISDNWVFVHIKVYRVWLINHKLCSLFVLWHSAVLGPTRSQMKVPMDLVRLYEWTRAFRS